jgi:hypothetical protein
MKEKEKSDLRLWLLGFGLILSSSALLLAGINTYVNYKRYKGGQQQQQQYLDYPDCPPYPQYRNRRGY